MNKHLNNIIDITGDAYSNACEHCANMVTFEDYREDPNAVSPWDLDLMAKLDAIYQANEKALTAAAIHQELLEI